MASTTSVQQGARLHTGHDRQSFPHKYQGVHSDNYTGNNAMNHSPSNFAAQNTTRGQSFQGFGVAHRPRAYGRFRENIASTLNLYQNAACVSRFGGIPWKKPDKRYKPRIEGLTEEIEDFFKYVKPTDAEHAARSMIVDRIKRIIQAEWPQAGVEVFGSFRTSLYLPTGDIDLVVGGQWDQIPPLFDLERLLVDREICDRSTLRVLDKAAVPLIKFRDRYTDIAVDISLNQVNCVKAADFVRKCTEEFPCLAPLTMVLKQFLQERNLNEVFFGGLSSYSLVLMIVHEEKEMVRSDRPNVGQLLLEFLDFFGDKFDYEKYGLRIKDGGSRVKKDDLRRDILHALAGAISPAQINPPSPQCVLTIEDPLTPGNDVSKGSYSVGVIREEFRQAHRILKAALNDDRDPFHSVLGRIIRITDYVVLHRVRVGQLVQSNELVQALLEPAGKAKAASASPSRRVPSFRRRSNDLPSRDGTVRRSNGTDSTDQPTASVAGCSRLGSNPRQNPPVGSPTAERPGPSTDTAVSPGAASIPGTASLVDLVAAPAQQTGDAAVRRLPAEGESCSRTATCPLAESGAGLAIRACRPILGAGGCGKSANHKTTGVDLDLTSWSLKSRPGKKPEKNAESDIGSCSGVGAQATTSHRRSHGARHQKGPSLRDETEFDRIILGDG